MFRDLGSSQETCRIYKCTYCTEPESPLFAMCKNGEALERGGGKLNEKKLSFVLPVERFAGETGQIEFEIFYMTGE